MGVLFLGCKVFPGRRETVGVSPAPLSRFNRASDTFALDDLFHELRIPGNVMPAIRIVRVAIEDAPNLVEDHI